MANDSIQRPFSRRDSLAALLLAFSAVPAVVRADGYPTKPVKLVIPYPPGGGTDITGRAMAQRLSESLGQSVVIENKPGG